MNNLVTDSLEKRADIQEPHVRIFRNLEEIESLRPVWTQWQQHPNCEIDFYSGVVSSTRSIVRPHVLVLYRGDQAVSMLVGRLDSSSVDLAIGYKKIVGIPARILTFLHGGLVGEKSEVNAEVMLRSITDSLANDEADVAYFNHLRTDEMLYGEIQRWPMGRRSRVAPRNHRGMTLATSGEGFVKTLTSKERNNQKRRTKRMQEDFGDNTKIVCYRVAEDFERVVRDVDAIATKTYQRRLGVAFQDSLEIRKRLQMEMERGWLRAYLLYLGDRPSAFWLGTAFSGTFYSGFTGYDPADSKYGPGMFLLLKAVEQLCEENPTFTLKKADFGLGDAEWKLIIGDQEWQEAPIFLFAPTSRGRVLSCARFGTEVLESAAKKVLERTHLIARVKKSWRNRLSARQNQKAQ